MGIIYNAEQRIFQLNTKNSTYLIQISKGDFLLHVYYGAKIPKITDFSDRQVRLATASFSAVSPSGGFTLDTAALEYPCSGTGDFRSSALQIKGANGNTATDIRYRGHEIFPGKYSIPGMPATYVENEEEAQTLAIVAEDALTGAEVTLYYTVFENYSAMARAVKIVNRGEHPFDIERVYSSCTDFQSRAFDMIHLHGHYGYERRIDRRPLDFGTQAIGSRRGSSSHQHNPFLALAASGATETAGDVYGFSFVYSGNFSIEAEVDCYETTRVLVGIHPADFNWHLNVGETFWTPETVSVYSDSGIGEMSRIFHKLYRYQLCRGEWKTKKRPIVVNNWEATYFNFDDEKLVAIAKDAAELGIEMLVMDDGWFGNRNNDCSSLGDWFVNENKIRGGLKSLVERINALGVKFGIWFEPEMVSPISKLYEAHPDWCLKIEGREMSIGRNQYVLDMSRADVRDYLFTCISDILSSANIEYVKWDFNRNLTEAGSALLPPERQKEVVHRYVLGLYELLERLTKTFPHILWEGCSGGGGRYDPAMLYYSPQIWTSDTTDAVRRVEIQFGTTMVYPASSMSAHVSAVPNHGSGRVTSFETRGNVAMAGAFGYELDLNKLDDHDRACVRKQVEDYHKYYRLIQDGDYYRIVSPFDQHDYCCWMYVSPEKDEALVTFVVMHWITRKVLFLKLQGLDEDKLYRDEISGKVYSGALLMHSGLNFSGYYGDGSSLTVHLKEIKTE